MINTDYLQIGNVVAHEDLGICKVVLVTKKFIGVDKSAFHDDAEEFNGIRLTPDLLTKLGGTWDYHCDTGTIKVWRLGHFKFWEYSSGSFEGIASMECLHDLQNQYLMKTSEHLNISVLFNEA